MFELVEQHHSYSIIIKHSSSIFFNAISYSRKFFRFSSRVVYLTFVLTTIFKADI